MKATTSILVVAAMAMGVAAQSPAASSTPADAPTTPATSTGPPPEIAKLLQCIKDSCDDDIKNVQCIAKKCTNTAAPTREQAEATNKCYADCDGKKGNAADYKSCTAGCVNSHFLADSPGAQNNPSITGNTNGTSTVNGNSTSDKNSTSSGAAVFGTSSATYSTMVAAVALFASFFVL